MRKLNHFTFMLIIFSAAWLSLLLSFPRILKGENTAVCPFVPSFRWFERYIPQILVTEICETDINMFTCCCPSQACLNLLFFLGGAQLCLHALQLSHPNLLVSSSSCCSSLFQLPICHNIAHNSKHTCMHSSDRRSSRYEIQF